ncbi:MAG: aspartate--tRNA ligase [Hyphomicrobiaceae bacterium]|nr:aspartate--tRNA ligase [Hyphomicrobiaceae bacterium]
MHSYRTHTCGQLRAGDTGKTARLSGWIHRKRDHGHLLFVDLRDHYGLTQVVVDTSNPVFKQLEHLRLESVVTVTGEVVARSAETVNAKLPTGAVELRAREFSLQSESKELPLPVSVEADYPEDIRLRYRYLDLRRDKLHRNIMLRAAVIASIRRRMIEQGFTEFQTPILTASSPEGARDYLVPSRIHPGKFYALPQAPQMFKQLLMMAGFDRYFQIAPCFRDEDPRADRLPGEFYQLDLEMSFVEQEDIFQTMEPILTGVFEKFADGKPVTKVWPRIPYDEAIAKYGSDKPDLRNPIEMQDVTEHFRDSGFKVFAGMIAKDPAVRVWAIPAPTGGSRAFCDRMNSWAQGEGQPGLGYIFWREDEGAAGAGPIAKNIGAERAEAIQKQLGLKTGDAAFFVAGKPANFYKFAGAARDRVGSELKLVKEGEFALAWIVDFPFYEWNEEDKKIDFSHNPFSMPKGGREALEAAEKSGRDALLGLKANQYDIVCNGYEIASGSVRNHVPETMVKAFEITGLTQKDVEDRFGGLYRAFQYGAPPHGGMAAGIERMVMLLTGSKAVRDVALFPMNQQAQDLLMNAPSEATPKQLRELSIRVVLDQKKGA